MNARKHKRTLQECLSFLSANGIGITEQVEKLIQFFYSADHHVSFDDVRTFITNSNLDIPNSMIRDVFNLLVEYGFAMIKVFGDDTVRYEHLHYGEHHDHFYCLKCGRIIEFFSPEIEEAQLRSARNHNFHMFSHKLQIHGLCDRCFGKSSRATIPLAMVESGGRFRIADIAEGCNHEHYSLMKRRLQDMGIVCGVEGEVITNHGGRIVLYVNETRVAVGRGMSQAVRVTLIE